jgi:hypothetical protein
MLDGLYILYKHGTDALEGTSFKPTFVFANMVSEPLFLDIAA